VVPALTRAATLARQATEALDHLAARELDALGTTHRDGAITLSVPALRALPSFVAPEVLRQAAARLGGHAPLRAWAHRGLARVVASPPARRPFRLGGVMVEVSGDRVRLGREPTRPLPPRTLTVPGRVDLPELGHELRAAVVDRASYVIPADPQVAAFDAELLPATLLVRPRARGDRLIAFGGTERRLKTLLISARIPRWDRSRVAVVEAGGDVLWVAGIRRAARAPVTACTRRVLELSLVAIPASARE
jgi:tRNA(Ile)-lysidine synthase